MTTTPAKGLTQPTVGGDNNTWGGELNTDLALIDSALGGTLSKSISGTTTSLSGTDVQNAGYVFTGALTATNVITWSAFSGFAAITNSTTGNQLIACGLGGAYTYFLPGEAALIWSDGTNFNKVSQVGPAPNVLINPFMEIDQANEGNTVNLASGVNSYVVDGWQAAFHSSTAVVTAFRSADGPLTFPNSLKVSVTTGASVAAGDYINIVQYIEANSITDLSPGNAAAKTLNLSFWVKSSIGSYTMCGAIRNFSATRSYPFNISITSAATWEKKTITIPGDVTGTWVTSGAASGMILNLCAAVGSTAQGTANTWASANTFGTSSCTNTLLSTNGATFQITGVKLEASPIPTPYGQLNFGDELMRCQRYYQKSYDLGTAVASATHASMVPISPSPTLTGTSGAGGILLNPPMRAAPTVAIYDGAGNSGKDSYYTSSAWGDNNSAPLVQQTGTKSVVLSFGSAPANTVYVHYTADARL